MQAVQAELHWRHWPAGAVTGLRYLPTGQVRQALEPAPEQLVQGEVHKGQLPLGEVPTRKYLPTAQERHLLVPAPSQVAHVRSQAVHSPVGVTLFVFTTLK